MGAGLGRTHPPAMAGPPRPPCSDTAPELRPAAATCARATRGRTAKPTPGTRRPSSSPTTSPPCCPTARRRASRTATSCGRRVSGARVAYCASRPATTRPSAAWPPTPSAASSICGPSTRPSWAGRTAGCRSSRTAARRWAPRARIRTARSGRARPCRCRPPGRMRRSCGGATGRGSACCSPTRSRSTAGRGSSWRTRTGSWWCPSGRPGRSRPWSCHGGRSSACPTWEARNATPWP